MRVIIIFTLFLSVSSNAWAFSCPDPGKPGQSVTFVEDANLNDIGYSYISSNGKAVISWNSTVANKMDPALAEFFKYHECAHIQDLYYSKGQIMKVYGPLKESRTDCLALLAMQSDGILTQSKFTRIVKGISQLPTTNVHTHFPGPKRALVIIDDCMAHNKFKLK